MQIDLKNLAAGYGTRTVLAGVNLQISGGIAGLLGPNGAGKSTLLKTLMGFLPPLSGDAQVFGLPLPQSAIQVRSRIGYMPETESYIPGISTVQFVAYMARLSGLPAEAAMERAHEVLQYVGLGEARYRNQETYSLGMKQRAKLAQAIVHDPALLLLDEPTNGMDPEGRREMLELVDDLGHRKGMTVILCSHLLHDVETVADQIIVIGNGGVVSRQFRDPASAPADGATRRQAYVIRLRGNAEEYMRRLEQDEGLLARPNPENGTIVVALPEGVGADTRLLFQTAEQCDALILRLTEQREGLEEIFVKAVGELGDAHL